MMQKNSVFFRYWTALLIFGVLMVSTLFSSFAISQTVGIDLLGAKDKQWIGETYSGYIARVESSTTASLSTSEKEAVDLLIKQINSQRKKAYEEIAQKNHLSVEIIATLAGEKLVKQVKPGHLAKGLNGQWKKF